MNHQLPPRPGAEELASAHWFKATKSANGSDCVEVAHMAHWTAVRDSKSPAGPYQLYTPSEWECFLDGVRKGEFDRA